MSSEPTHDFLMANLKREEAEKQDQAAMRLAKQEQKTFMRKRSWKTKEQMALQELEEDHRKHVAAAKKEEANLMDNRTLFNYSSSELITNFT